jgi:hypothetical protein
MDSKTIAVLLSSLATAPLVVGCAKPQTSEVPASDDHDSAIGEHACGNHAEGACGSATPNEAAPMSRSFSIAPGEFAEVNFEMAEGSTVVVDFSEGSNDIEWDVHSHGPSGESMVHDDGRGGVGNVEFKAPAAGVFSVLWKNAGSTSTPLDVRVTLGEGASIDSWMPAPSQS